MDQILEFFHSEHNDNILNVDLQMPQAWLVVTTSSKIYTVSTVLFHKYGGEVTFYMFVPTKATMKFANVNAGNSQLIGIILCF